MVQDGLFLNIIQIADKRQVTIAASTLSLQNVKCSEVGNCGRIVFYQQELLVFLLLPEQITIRNLLPAYQSSRSRKRIRLCITILPIMEHNEFDALICLNDFF